ncbi:hypothetical protein N8T08_002327 [Aspergillus melleus]|uniref:Uncharacterized protein n=1 Tax=Aspergillus melleus TaxID=138277 RepID=A0ACC3B983_9EURO|nr:hypothetical protein N8T08_002327 [Aspergillus melleus]
MGPPKKSLNRPKKRVLVRWDENLNELLLLCVQSVCNAQSVKIPWPEVARTMGHNVTEGAIVQHLAKLRARRAATGKDVPPPLRRGGVGAAIKPSKPTTTGSKRKAHISPSGSDDESSIHFECDDASSDEEYTEKRRSKRKPKMAKRESTPIKVESDLEQDKREEVSASSEELLVPGASFLDFPNSNVSDDSSAESSPSPAGRSKIVVLKYRRQTEENQESLFGGEEEEIALPPAEAGADLDVIGNNRSQPFGFDFNVDEPLANPEVNPDYLLFQPFENMREGSYITRAGITYETTLLQNDSELPTGLGDDYFLNDPTFSYQDMLEADENLDFY